MEHTLECGFGNQFFPVALSFLFKSCIHFLRPSGFLRSVGNGYNTKGGGQMHCPTPFLDPG